MRHRALNRSIANALGYFWLPCPICGQEYGAHEHMQIPDGVKASIPAPDGPQGAGLCICPDCALDGRGFDDPLLMAKFDRWAEEHRMAHPELGGGGGE